MVLLMQWERHIWVKKLFFFSIPHFPRKRQEGIYTHLMLAFNLLTRVIPRNERWDPTSRGAMRCSLHQGCSPELFILLVRRCC